MIYMTILSHNQEMLSMMLLLSDTTAHKHLLSNADASTRQQHDFNHLTTILLQAADTIPKYKPNQEKHHKLCEGLFSREQSNKQYHHTSMMVLMNGRIIVSLSLSLDGTSFQ